MKQIRFHLIFGLLLVIIFLIIFQFNQEYFETAQKLTLLDVKVHYETPEWPNYLHYLIVFAFGIVVSSVFRMRKWFRTGKQTKELKKAFNQQEQKISELESELEILRGGPAITGGAAPAVESPDNKADVVYSREGTAKTE